mmetsp:Transcript_142552/g.397177  ORF Transcript_142552/g.397177 Transcript_142552/m.397177 type:complete len:208 (+) Transcript_142552:77-700(+)
MALRGPRSHWTSQPRLRSRRSYSASRCPRVVACRWMWSRGRTWRSHHGSLIARTASGSSSRPCAGQRSSSTACGQSHPRPWGATSCSAWLATSSSPILARRPARAAAAASTKTARARSSQSWLRPSGCWRACRRAPASWTSAGARVPGQSSYWLTGNSPCAVSASLSGATQAARRIGRRRRKTTGTKNSWSKPTGARSGVLTARATF